VRRHPQAVRERKPESKGRARAERERTQRHRLGFEPSNGVNDRGDWQAPERLISRERALRAHGEAASLERYDIKALERAVLAQPAREDPRRVTRAALRRGALQDCAFRVPKSC